MVCDTALKEIVSFFFKKKNTKKTHQKHNKSSDEIINIKLSIFLFSNFAYTKKYGNIEIIDFAPKSHEI